MRIRRYLESDRELCLAVFDSNVPDEFSTSEREEYMAFLSDLPGPYWVVEEHWEVVGCGGVAHEPDGESVALCWGMVRRDRQGEGWGRYLLRARLAWVRREGGVRRVLVRTSRRAVGFFERFGFEAVGEGMPADETERVEMRLELGSGDPEA